MYFYTSADSDLTSGLDNAVLRAIDDNAVSILSMSFGECEAGLGTSGNSFFLEAAQQAAAQGISFVVSAGDGGPAGCDDFDTATQAQYGLAVSGMASTPWTIAVGGTDFDVLPQSFSMYANAASNGTAPYYRTALKYIPENPWNDSTTVNTAVANNVRYGNSQGQGNIIAGSGGASAVYSKPSFQSSLTPADGARDLPDVSLFASNGFEDAVWALCSDNVTDGVTSETFTDCQTSSGQLQNGTTISGVGGTSASAPAFAGMLALVAQAQGGARLGQANAVLYQLAKSKYTTVFHDVTVGDNSVPCASGSPNCAANGFLTGYNAGPGYDLATGLGSVDVAQMISNWSSVALTSTSTTLTLNGSTAAYSGVHGAALTLNVGVTPTAATGAVAVIDTANETAGGTSSGPQNNGQFSIPLTSGAGTASYNGLPGGTYTVSARYGGDTADASSTSTPISATIAPEASTTALTVNAYNPVTGKAISNVNIPYGYHVFADAAITGTAEGSKTQGVATGTVQFLNGGTALGSSPVSSGNQASWPPTNSSLGAFPAGSYNLTAQYSGDASYSASSGTANFTVVKASTTTSAGYAQTTIEYGNSVQIAADALTTSYGVAPTGTFQFYVDGQPVLGPQAIYESGPYNNANGNNNWAWADASTSYAFLSLGQHTLSAAYSGDVNYAGSTSTTTSATVVQATSGVLEWGFDNSQQNPAVVGQSVTGTASVFGSQYGVPPTGTITFYDGSTALTDPVTYTSTPGGSGFVSALHATTQHVFTTTGTHFISVSYSGDTNYTSATSPGTQSLNVAGPLSVTAAGAMTISAPGQSGSVLLSVAPLAGFTGTVTLSCATPSTALEATCGFGSGSNITSTTQVTITGPAATANFSVTTTAQHQSAALSGWRSNGILFAALFVVIAPMRRWNRRLGLIVLAIGVIVCQIGCGGGGGSTGTGGGGKTDPGTPAGTYDFTVTATSGSGASSYSTTAVVTVVVQ